MHSSGNTLGLCIHQQSIPMPCNSYPQNAKLSNNQPLLSCAQVHKLTGFSFSRLHLQQKVVFTCLQAESWIQVCSSHIHTETDVSS